MILISNKNQKILSYIESLEPGTKVSVRELAEKLDVSEGTAYKAVKDAEQQGLVSVRPKAGTIRVDTQPEDFKEQITAWDVARLLGLVAATGKELLSVQVKRLIVCDGSQQDLLRQLNGQEPRACLCLCGDRPEMQDAVLEQGANLLLTGGTKPSWYLTSFAERKGLYILCSPQSSGSLLRQFYARYSGQTDVSGNTTVGDWMQTPDYLYYNDIVADWQRLYFETSRSKQYPVVDDELEIYGGLDMWRAAAAVPSEKIRSLVGDELAFPLVSVHDDIRNIARKFIVNGDALAAVLDGKRMVGILTTNDLLRCYMYSEPESYEASADSFLIKDQTASTQETAVYSVRLPEPALNAFPYLEMDLLFSGANSHLQQYGSGKYRFDSGTFFSTARIGFSNGLLLTSRLRPNGKKSCVIEAEINDDSRSYAKAVFVVSEESGEENGEYV